MVSVNSALNREKTAAHMGGVVVPFGLRNGRLFEPLRVEAGLRCGCVCPGCGTLLIAKHALGGRITPHFAHASSALCRGGLESALHLAAKQLIEERRVLYLPPLVAMVEGPGQFTPVLQRSALLRQGGTVSLAAVRMEQSLGAIRPDLVVNHQGGELLVEVAYTHFVDAVKLQRIKKLGLGALEIDISDLKTLDFESLSSRLFDATPHSAWLFHPDSAAMEEDLRAQLAADIKEDAFQARQASARRRAEARERERHVQEQIALAEQRVIKAQKARLNAARSRPEQYAALHEAEKVARALEYLGLSRAGVPPFLSQRVRNYGAIAARPETWQLGAYASLISTAHGRGVDAVSTREVLAWVRARFWVDESRADPEVAVWDFLSGLAECQILEEQQGQQFLVVATDFSAAREVALDSERPGKHAQKWSQDFPDGERSSLVAGVFASMYGAERFWRELAELVPTIREREDPLETMRHYAKSSLNNAAALARIRRFFLSTGFTRLAR